MADSPVPAARASSYLPWRQWLGVVLAFFATLALGAALVYLDERNQALQAQKAALGVASSSAHLLQEQLNRSLSATYAIAAVLRQGKGKIDNFDALAANMLSLYGGGISALQLAPKGVIANIVPMAGNEAAFGHNLLADPQRNKEAFAAVETHKLTLAGPFMLRQGGAGVVGRLPVFLPDADGHEQFWGFTTAVIRIPDLLAASRINAIAALGYDYELSRVNPDHRQQDVFARSSDTPLVEPVSFDLEVPNGHWSLRLARSGGWGSPPAELALQAILVAVVAAVVALLAYFLLRQPYLLGRQVSLQTRDLSEARIRLEAEIRECRQTEEKLQGELLDIQAILDSFADGIVAVDSWGRIRQTNAAARQLLGKDGESCQGQLLSHLLRLESDGAEQDLQDIYRSVVREGKGWPFAADQKLRTGDGGVFSARLDAFPAPGGRKMAMILVFSAVSPVAPG